MLFTHVSPPTFLRISYKYKKKAFLSSNCKVLSWAKRHEKQEQIVRMMSSNTNNTHPLHETSTLDLSNQGYSKYKGQLFHMQQYISLNLIFFLQNIIRSNYVDGRKTTTFLIVQTVSQYSYFYI